MAQVVLCILLEDAHGHPDHLGIAISLIHRTSDNKLKSPRIRHHDVSSKSKSELTVHLLLHYIN